jgi:hypothetical protein
VALIKVINLTFSPFIMHIKINNRHNHILLPLIIFTLIWSLIFISSNILNAGFNYFVDDHEIVVAHGIYHGFNDIFVQPFISLFSNQPKSRFRPIYDVLLRLCTQLYGLNPFIWYLSSLLVAITTSIIFYLVGKFQDFSQLEAIGFAGLIMFGQQASTYTRFGTPETTATLFIALSFLCGSLNSDRAIDRKFYSYLFIVFALLGALNKEACILMLPGLAFLKIWHLAQTNNISLKDSFIVSKYITIFTATCFFVLLAYIKLVGIDGPGYAGIDGDTLSIARVFNSLLSNIAIFGSAIIANIGYFISSENRDRAHMGCLYFLTSLIIIPQLIIYNKTGMVWHYILPAAIGVSLLVFYPISKIKRKSSKLYRIVISMVLIILALQVIFTNNYFLEISKRTVPIQVMLSDISNCVRQIDPLLIVGNPYLDNELLTAFHQIRNSVIHNDQILLVTYGSQNSDLKIDAMKEDEQKWHFLGTESLKSIYKTSTIDRQNLIKSRGIILANASKVEKSLVALNLDWFQLDRLMKKYYPELDISVYCKR